MDKSHIINAEFGRFRSTTTAPRFRYDIGQVLKFTDLDLPPVYETHICNEGSRSTKTVIGDENGVLIPDEYFKSGEDIIVYVYLHDESSDGRTILKATIPIKNRPTITDEVPTEEQQSQIDKAIADFQEVAEKAETALTHYPIVINGNWYVWDVENGSWVDTGVEAQGGADRRVQSLDGTQFAAANVIEAIGNPVYVKEEDLPQYSRYNLTQTGWYVFARITGRPDDVVASNTIITGAEGYYAVSGANYIEVAVRFEVASVAQTVRVSWNGEDEEVFVFKATDLAVTNLDYRVTYYMYDIDDYATWEFKLTEDTKFEENIFYYTKNGNEYEPVSVTVGEDIPANTYYVHSKVTFEGMARNITYRCNTVIDCPTEIVLPRIDDENHGAWFEIRFRHSGSFSTTLIPRDPEAVVETEHTQVESAGINMVNLHYSSVGGAKVWRFMNTHSTLPGTPTNEIIEGGDDDG